MGVTSTSEKLKGRSIKQVRRKSVEWIQVAQDRAPVRGSCEHGNAASVPSKAENFLTSFSRKTLLH